MAFVPVFFSEMLPAMHRAFIPANSRSMLFKIKFFSAIPPSGTLLLIAMGVGGATGAVVAAIDYFH